MSNVLTKNFVAGAAILAATQVKFGADDNTVVPATGPTDLIIGVTTDIAAALGERVDVQMIGTAYVVAGAAATRGTLATSDASGRAVTAAPAAGVNNNTVGRFLESPSAAGDMVRVLLNPGSVQG
ncbi:hypothetical protein CAP31_03845 [Sulfuriferula sp. AH1]|uniref:DUF2190 family protein n=1 Tax=Sulfuriferula sp. AH1 TaxID=1985873 RepID=UPI000B3BA8B7|nr:DUF2190 family protein [Sulfuriferula sp. AH1]ARU30895.1 hypothetical protein CAP31_03845 [Sulfuriferula sp. AH1]